MLGLLAAGLGIGALQAGGAKGLAGMIFDGGRMAMKGYGKSKAKFPKLTKGVTGVGILGGGGLALSSGVGAYQEKKREWYSSKYGEEKTQEYYDARASAFKTASIVGPAALGVSALAAWKGGAFLSAVGGSFQKGVVGGMTGTFNPSTGQRVAKRFTPGWKSATALGAAGGIGMGAAMARSNPRNRPSPEGMISGIRSAPMGGISPELQFSTQGLTLGIHNSRSRRIV